MTRWVREMNREERMKMVKAMEYIARQLNDTEIFGAWLADGVADGDIAYGDLTTYAALDAVDWYIEDQHFSDLMETFLRCMKAAKRSGGLYCDGVVSGVDYSAEDEQA